MDITIPVHINVWILLFVITNIWELRLHQGMAATMQRMLCHRAGQESRVDSLKEVTFWSIPGMPLIQRGM